MANTYTQIHIHAVFAVKYRTALIQSTWKERLHQYITGIIQNNGYKVLFDEQYVFKLPG
jgi:putative transposase